MKNSGIKTLYAAIVITVVGYTSTVCGCGRLLEDPKPAPVDTRTVFQRKTDAKFTDRTCAYSKNVEYAIVNPVTGVEGTVTADERALCVATSKDPLDIFLVDRSANGPTTLETQLTSATPPPYAILVGKGQDVGAVIDAYYVNIAAKRAFLLKKQGMRWRG